MTAAQLLLRVLRAWPEGPAQPPPALSPDVESELAQLAALHGVAGVVQRFLPSPQGSALHGETLEAAARVMRVRLQLQRALDALAAVDIVPVLLKGYGLALRLYPDPLLRATSDVDLLVTREQLPAAEAALRRLGLSPHHDADEYYPLEYRHHLSLEGPGTLVELHFRPNISYGIPWEADQLIARSSLAELDGRPVRYLRAEDELVYLALHAANHMLQRLAWLLDLKLLIRAEPLDWDEVLRVAGESRSPHAVFYALDAARRAVGAQVPEHVLQALAPARLKQALARAAFSERHLVATTLYRHKPLWAAAKILLADSYAQVALFSARRLAWSGRRRAARSP